jgi:hypothetical protein
MRPRGLNQTDGGYDVGTYALHLFIQPSKENDMKRESRILWDPDDTWISEELVNDLVASENTAAMKRPRVAKIAPEGNNAVEWAALGPDGRERTYVARTAALPGNRMFVLDVFRDNQWHAHCTWDQFEAAVTAAWKAHCDVRNKTPEQKIDELTQDVRRLEEEVRRLQVRFDARF